MSDRVPFCKKLIRRKIPRASAGGVVVGGGGLECKHTFPMFILVGEAVYTGVHLSAPASLSLSILHSKQGPGPPKVRPRIAKHAGKAQA
jgi:hypothetical protein